MAFHKEHLGKRFRLRPRHWRVLIHLDQLFERILRRHIVLTRDIEERTYSVDVGS